MPLPVFLALLFATGVVGFVGGFMLIAFWGAYQDHRIGTRIWTLIQHADNADKKNHQLRKKPWRGRPFRVDSPVPELPAKNAPDGAKEVTDHE